LPQSKLLPNFKAIFMQSQPYSFFRFFIALCGMAIMVTGVQAEAPVVRLSGKPVWLKTYAPYTQKISRREVANGYFYQLSEEQIQVEKHADYRHFIREIVSETGIQNGSQISVSFDPSYERLDFHDLTVWRNGKPQSRLSTADFKVLADEEELSKFIYQGSYSAVCILKDIRKGDRIEYAYTVTGSNPIFGNHFSRDFYFQSAQPAAQVYRAVLASPGRKLYFKNFNHVPQVTVSSYNGLSCYEWEAKQVKPYPADDYSPGWYEVYDHVQLTDFASWKQVIDWAMQFNAVHNHVSGQLAQRVAQLKAASGNSKEKYFRMATQLVQDEVRYMGIEMGQYSHRANTPENVYNHRYGDCKDKALLLASILNADGIEAYMMLVNTSLKAKVSDYLPSSGVFDHAVVAANVNGKPVYVDATMSYQRGTGTDIYFPNYGKGLVLKGGNTGFTTLPLSPGGKTIMEETYTIPDEKGKVNLQVRTSYSLGEADRMRDKINSKSIEETEKDYLNYYSATYANIESADTLTVIDDEKENRLTTIEHYLITNFYKKGDEEGTFKAGFYADPIKNLLIKVPAKINTPISVSFPETTEYTVKVVMPNGWDINFEEQNIKRNSYLFHSSIKVDRDTTLILSYNFSYLKDHVPANEVEQYRKDVQQLRDNELSYSYTYTPDRKAVAFRLNYILLAYGLVLMSVCAYLAFRYYRKETPGIIFQAGADFVPIGGWLVVVGIGLLGSGLSILYYLVSSYLDVHTWQVHYNSVSVPSYHSLIVFEFTCKVLAFSAVIFGSVLFINKRDIFPKYMIALYAFLMIYSFADYLFTWTVMNGWTDQSTQYNLVRSLIFGGIWISYFKKSVRVEETFIVPYPPTNYSYQREDYNLAADKTIQDRL
jgi:transglutaminase-like putative cysteine protease